MTPEHVERYLVKEVHEEDEDGGTYGVFDLDTGRRHVIKVRGPSCPPEIVEALRREFTIQSAVRHPNVAYASRCFTLPDGSEVLVLDHATAGALSDWMTGAPVATGLRRAVLAGVLDGLGAAHAEGYVHRDLKPENVLIASGRDGITVQVADFGMAKDLAETAWVPAIGLSAHFTFLGTPGYMAPEQMADPASVDRRADLYSVGCLLYEMLVGHLPADPDTPGYERRVARGEWIRPAGMAPWALDLLEVLLATDRSRRPADCAAVRASLVAAGELR
ncbi:MAG: serine/threonine protein kinase [Myxococcales bacterium]|nr:serine/threonine protein kinase [Myxococcales bacterium]MCB9671047.1 serine/threonine protein kinase [Alphaproteobacteria bacterium]MCB9692302.1 serine/threonine protein kinase [Alphaproteobacteria bacterium]